MRLTRSAKELQEWTECYRRAGLGVGLAPTLGGLHGGHLALFDRARSECERVVASIYLNPTQFNAAADLESYPADLGADLEACRGAGVDLVYVGQRQDLLPPGFQTGVEVTELSRRLCGAFRPGHFRGVVTVVSQLLHVAKPHRAYFGCKDYQQARVIERLVRDLVMDVEIRLVPTVREPDGLALSSRNALLNPEERAVAPALYRTLREVEERIRSGERRTDVLEAFLREKLSGEPRLEVEYAEILDGATLEPFAAGELAGRGGGVLVAVAVHLGAARLIDNILISPEKGSERGV
ncbi:MAG: pantoate--beta-alanine ligase [Planctomycetota bacterium]|nr:pantoate--beta-alanine ligase [Planctomycetota bacterium]